MRNTANIKDGRLLDLRSMQHERGSDIKLAEYDGPCVGIPHAVGCA
jgi:hypothetical protein